jgi:hypothetical protein
MSEHIEALAKTASTVSYGLSGWLVAGTWMEFLNTNAAAIGVILAFFTFWVNVYFQWLNHRAIKSRYDDDDL